MIKGEWSIFVNFLCEMKILRNIMVISAVICFNIMNYPLCAQDKLELAEKLYYTSCNNIAIIEDERSQQEVYIIIEKIMPELNPQEVSYTISDGYRIQNVKKEELKYAINIAVIQAANQINSQELFRQSKRLSKRIYEDFERFEN